ncbi:Peptidase M20 [Niveomyces insectorum RCEF 264]|uniref:Peptidase M20 n=1 Tax=Niveomyces insectorum RCEF 264 TaxID=1081102 RepID=A0A162JA00_9HYPO|nr:Peptidase M20 [Niveomyces insectorum RCEF 264]
MDPKSLLLQALAADQDSHVRLLQAFVQSPSPNPPGNTDAAAAVLTNYLRQRNIPYDTITPQVGQPNVVSDFVGGNGPGPRVVLNGHMDVFPVGDTAADWDRDPWSGAIEGDRLHGRGVVDMKSGTAALVVAYAYLYARRAELRGSVALCAVSDEETGGKWGTKFLLEADRQRWGGDVMLSAEPAGCGSVRFSEKGTLRMRCTVRTRGAHGAYTNLSKGAVRTAAAFIEQVVPAVEGLSFHLPDDMAAQLRQPAVRRTIDAIMGPGTADVIARPTVNVSIIQGGGPAINVIPDTCTVSLDIRMPVGLTRKEVLAAIEGIVATHSDATIELDVIEPASNPASYSTLSHPMLALLADNAAALDPDSEAPPPIPSMGATDCKHYRYAGIPAYVYGCSPMTMAQVNESGSIREFLHVTKVHASAVWDFLQ